MNGFEKIMLAFIIAVIVAGLFGPWFISLMMSAVLLAAWKMRRKRGRSALF